MFFRAAKLCFWTGSKVISTLPDSLGPSQPSLLHWRQTLIRDHGPYSVRVFHIAVSLVGVPIHAGADVVKVIVCANLALDYFSVDVLPAQNGNILAVHPKRHARVADPLTWLT
jgi:hypothetical protein